MEFLGRGLWNLPELLLGFVSCPVSLQLKAATLRTLAALCPVPGVDQDVQTTAGFVRTLWFNLEKAQILRTRPVGPGLSITQIGDIRVSWGVIVGLLDFGYEDGQFFLFAQCLAALNPTFYLTCFLLT
jgi:hypothetical protein